MRFRYFSICILVLISACAISVSHATAQEQNPPAPVSVVAENVSDFTRIPYGADVPLQDLQPGRYLLKVTITDNLAKASASQDYLFQID
jgi:hypothetical protein